MRYFLRQILPPSDPEPPIEISLSADTVFLGRRRSKSLTKYPQISRDHAVFYKSDDGSIFVKDLNSLNGVFVNDVRIGSSLKKLTPGDKIGLGVASSGLAEGFVCVFCTEDGRREETEIYDDGDDTSGRISDAKIPNLRIVKSEPRSPTASEVVCPDGDIRSSDEPPTGTENIRCKVERDESNPRAHNKVNGYTKSIVHVPDSRDIGSAPRLQNLSTCDRQPVFRQPAIETETKPPKYISVRRCFIPLVRCDDVGFRFPPDVKNPFRTGRSEQTKLPPHRGPPPDLRDRRSRRRKRHLNRKRKRIRALSSDSSGDSVENVRLSPPPEARLAASECSRKRSKMLSTDSSCDSDENVRLSTSSEAREDLFTGKQKRTRTSSVSSNDTEKILYPSASCRARLNADRTDSDESDSDSRTNRANHVNSARKRTVCRTETRGSLENGDDDGELRYSQNDETFYIRDDESYLDVKPSQTRKRESDRESDSYVEIFGTDSHSSPGPKTSLRKERDDNDESIESILAFVTGLETDSSRSDSRPPDGCIRRHSEDTDCEQFEDYASSPIIHKAPSDPSRVRKSNGIRTPDSSRVTEKEDLRKHSRKTLLTEPQPLTYKPKKFRGRDENFVERRKPPLNASAAGSKERRAKTLNGHEIESRHSEFVYRNHEKFVKKKISHLSHRHPSTASTAKSEPSFTPTESSPRHLGPKVDVDDGNRIAASSQSVRPAEDEGRSSAENRVDRPAVPTPGNSYASSTTLCRDPRVTKGKSYQKVIERRPQNGVSPNEKTSFSGVLKQLLQMNTSWLQEQDAIQRAPPAVIQGAAPLSQTYESYESYAGRLRPMILLEIWEQMYAESSRVRASGKRHKMFCFAILSHVVRGELVELECESVVDEGVCFGPREGCMALMELREGPDRCSLSFGYVFRHGTRPLQPGALLGTPWEGLPDGWTRNARHWTFHACVKRKREVTSFERGVLMRGNGLGYVCGRLRWANALHSFRQSPLLEGVLRPEVTTFAKKGKNSRVTTDRHHTVAQSRFVRCVSDEILGSSDPPPTVFLLKGGPGTGKTHAIVGLLERLFYCRATTTQPDVRVVVAAPSDSAVDEIGLRLVRLGRRYREKGRDDVKLVRLGVEGQVNRRMVPYLVTSLARKLRQASSADTRSDASLRVDVLKSCRVVLSTLCSCIPLPFKPSCCIVDDAAQCTELETLQAIALGSPRLVLAGDPSQRRPEVLSWEAERLGLGRSLFERMIARCPEKAHSLVQQFRMHPEIARFPYPSLTTHPDAVLDTSRCPLRPYLVLDLPAGDDSFVLSSLCEFVCAQDPRATVGLIASPPHRASLCSGWLRRRCSRVEVHTLDGFLGREVDVVVLWADFPCPRQLNSALTRAAKCLIVCVRSEEVDSHPHWRALLEDARDRGLYASFPTPGDVVRGLRDYLLKRNDARQVSFDADARGMHAQTYTYR